MSSLKYFSDWNGQTAELISVIGLPNAEFATRFPLVEGRRFDGFDMMVGYAAGSRDMLPVMRAVEYKARPSRHVCDDRCLHATGKVMRCECSCGGKNHGKGHR